MIEIKTVVLEHAQNLPLPDYQSKGAAGMDLYAAIPHDQPVQIASGQRRLIETGLSIALPDNYEAQIRPRSGLALKHGITVLNTPGTVDCDFRGEIKVLLINLGQDNFEIKRGDRIAQMIIAPVIHGQLVKVDALPPTTRGNQGYGSTGVS